MQSSLLKKFFLIFIAMGTLCLAVPALAGVGVGVYVNVPVPAPQVVVSPPGGFEQCYTVPSGYDNGYYIHAHRVCEYVDSPYGGVWVGGFWQCSYFHNGICRGPWAWRPSHWAQYGGPEYGVVWHNEGWYHRGGYGPGYGPRYGHGYERGYNHGYNHGGYNHGGHHGDGNWGR